MSNFLNMYLQSLLEAPGDNRRTSNQRNRRSGDNPDDPDAQENQTDTQNTEEDTGEEGTDQEDATSDEGSEEETGTDDDAEQGNEDETENQNDENNEGEEQDNENEGEDNEGEGGNDEDDFSLDPAGDEGEGDDNDPPPDGLTDPDDDGSNDNTEDKDAETNVHVNVLNLSKIDRVLAKRRCLSDFYDLRTSIDTFRNIIENNEATIEPTVRDMAVRDLNKLYSTLEDYLMYKFSYTNYEENLQNYFIFMRNMNDIVKIVNKKGLNGKKKG